MTRPRLDPVLIKPEEDKFCRMVAEGGKSYVEIIRECFPKWAKWKDASLNRQASIMLATDRLRNKVNEYRAAQLAIAKEKFELSAETWAQQVSRIAFSDPRRLVDENGRVKQLHELDDDIAAAITEVQFNPLTGAPTYKLERKTAALDQIARRLKLYVDVQQQTNIQVNIEDSIGLARMIAMALKLAADRIPIEAPSR